MTSATFDIPTTPCAKAALGGGADAVESARKKGCSRANYAIWWQSHERLHLQKHPFLFSVLNFDIQQQQQQQPIEKRTTSSLNKKTFHYRSVFHIIYIHIKQQQQLMLKKQL